MEFEGLGDRMKAYEKNPIKFIDGNYLLDNTSPMIARIDGHSFSKFTRANCEKPFDAYFSQAMELTSSDLLIEFNATTAYTQSDEISLIFTPIQDEKTGDYRDWNFKGKLQKLVSLMAAYASTRFYFHFWNLSKELSGKFEAGQLAPHFDCRIFNLPNQEEVYNYIYWRSAHDCVRNSIHGVAMSYTKDLFGRSTKEMKAMLLTTYKFDYDKEIADRYKYGIYVKKDLVTIETTILGKSVKSLRTRPISFTRKLSGYDLDFSHLLVAKYYSTSPTPPPTPLPSGSSV